MKKLWLVGIGALLGTAMSANASLSFVWSHAQPPTVDTPTEVQWVDTSDGGPVTVTAQLFGSGISFAATFVTSGAFKGQEEFSITSTSPFVPGSPDAGSFLSVSVKPGVPAGPPSFTITKPNLVSGPGEPAITSPSDSTYHFGIVGNPGTGTTAELFQSDITFPTIPETNQLAIALGAAVIGATVLFRARRSPVA
jgi:hypothetical protein